jgi:selenocysteine-specific translation elongation factor
MTLKAKYLIEDTFKITGRGIVLAGSVVEGTIHLGDYIEFEAFNKKWRRKIIGIDDDIRYASPNRRKTGLLVKCEDDKEIDELRQWKPNGDLGVILKE